MLVDVIVGNAWWYTFIERKSYTSDL